MISSAFAKPPPLTASSMSDKRKLYFDVTKSRQELRLVYPLGISEIADTLTFILMMSFLGFGLSVFTAGIERQNVNFPFVAFVILPVGLCFSIYGIIRKLSDRRLVRIETDTPKKEIVDVLLAFLDQQQYDYKQLTDQVIFATEVEPLSYRRLWSKDIVFIFDDGELLFNIRKRYPTLNPPVFFSHLILKRRLSKHFSESGFHSTS